MAKNRNRPIFFVDQDDTLTLTVQVPPNRVPKEMVIIPGSAQYLANKFRGKRSPMYSKGEVLATIVRPSARPFLEALGVLGEVNILSIARSTHKLKALELLGLRSLVTNVWGFDNAPGSLQCPKGLWLIIDDDLRIAKHKMSWLDVNLEERDSAWDELLDQYVVQCRPWGYIYDDPNPLTDLLPLIKRKFAQQRKHRPQ